MDPGLFVAGTLAGLLLSWAWVSSEPEAQELGMPPVPRNTDAAVARAQQIFLPRTAENIQAIAATEPQVKSNWKAMAARLPYLTEAVAMYYAMSDPKTPKKPKILIAGALLYAVSPVDVIPDTIPGIGQLDDAGVLFGALKSVYNHINKSHMEQARAWLQSQGVDPKPLFAIGKDFSADESLPSATPLLTGPVAGAPGLPARDSWAPPLEDKQPATPFKGW